MNDSWYIVPDTVIDRIVTRPDDAPYALPESSDTPLIPAVWRPMLGLELPLFRRLPFAGGSLLDGPRYAMLWPNADQSGPFGGAVFAQPRIGGSHES